MFYSGSSPGGLLGGPEAKMLGMGSRGAKVIVPIFCLSRIRVSSLMRMSSRLSCGSCRSSFLLDCSD
jgi:hypothetical protein